MTNPYVILRINDEIKRKKNQEIKKNLKIEIEKCKSLCRYIAGYKCWKENDIKNCYNKCINKNK